jgi:hypothetical protein
LAIATWTLPVCVPSIFSKYTRSPAESTTATAIAQLFLRASATAGADGYIARPDGDIEWLTRRPPPKGF